MANKKLLDLDGLKRYNSKVNEELSRKQESLIRNEWRGRQQRSCSSIKRKRI